MINSLVVKSILDKKIESGGSASEAKEYTDQKIAELINGAPTTLDTLKEIADAMEESQDVVKALDESIGTKANASDLANFENDISKTIYSKNLFNPNDYTNGKYLTGTSEGENSNYFISNYMYLYDDTKDKLYIYTIDGSLNRYIQFYDKHKNVIHGEQILNGQSKEVSIIEGAKYARVSMQKTALDMNTYKTTVSYEQYSSYVEYKEPYKILISDNIPLNYENICINSSSELYSFLKNPKKYTNLILYPIEYDLYTGLYENDIISDLTDIIYLSDIKIFGNGATIKIEVPETVALQHLNACNSISGLNVGGNIKVSDLNIKVQNVRYALHDETLSNKENYYTIKKYLNCYFYHNLTNSEIITTVGNTVGIGGSLGQKYLFENCKFENPTPRGTFYIHGRDYNISELSFDNCYFVDKTLGHSLTPFQYTGNGIDCNINISNSYIGSVFLQKQNGGDVYCQWKINSINSHISRLILSNSFSDFAVPTRVNTIDGTVDTSCERY